MSDRLEALLLEADRLTDPRASDLTRELAAELLRIHGEAIGEILTKVKAAAHGTELLDDLAKLEKVKGVLLLHGLHPSSAEARAREALARNGDRLRRRGLTVEILGFDAGVLTLRATGGLGPKSDLQSAIEDTLFQDAPDLDRVEITWEAAPAAYENLIPLTSLNKRKTTAETTNDSCEMCGVGLGSTHDHLFESGKRKLRCVCTACALLFDAERSPNDVKMARKRIVQRAEHFPDGLLTDGEWSALGIPVSIAFFVSHGAEQGVTSYYPGAAGVIESPVSAQTWERLVLAHPRLASLHPEVEALFVVRSGKLRGAYRFSIDVCFEIAGHMRHRWQGLTGGKRVWDEVQTFFERLNLRGGELRA